MKFLLTLLAVGLVLIACNTRVEIGAAEPTPAPKPTLTLSRADVVATVAHMQQLAQEATKETAAAKDELATEHAAHLQAQQAATTAQAENAKLGQVAAQARADAAKWEADSAAKTKGIRSLRWLYALTVAGMFIAVGFVGATLETGICALVVAVGHLLLSGVSALRLLLKTACPTLFFWL